MQTPPNCAMVDPADVALKSAVDPKEAAKKGSVNPADPFSDRYYKKPAPTCAFLDRAASLSLFVQRL